MRNKLAQKIKLGAALLLMAGTSALAQISNQIYIPTPENIKARQEFQDNKFGIFLHWGIYSMTAQGEWYMNTHNINLMNTPNWHPDSILRASMLPNGFLPSKPPEPNISVLPVDTMTVSQCLIQKNPILIS